MDKQNKNLGLLTGTLDENAIRELSPLNLAYIGDTVYDLYIRGYLVKNKRSRVNELHKNASAVVNARVQAQAALMLETELNERESDIFRLGKNAKSTPPKNVSYEDYSLATGIEAVIGYLYLTGQTSRTDAFFSKIIAHFMGDDTHG